RRYSLGYLAPAFLAVALSIYHGLDGREPSRSHADRRIWLRSPDGGDCLLYSATRHHCQGRARLTPRVSRRRRLERETFAGALPRRHSARVRELMDRQRTLCVCRASLVDSRPSHRTGAGKARRVSSRVDCAVAAPAGPSRLLPWRDRWDNGTSNASRNSRLRTRLRQTEYAVIANLVKKPPRLFQLARM